MKCLCGYKGEGFINMEVVLQKEQSKPWFNFETKTYEDHGDTERVQYAVIMYACPKYGTVTIGKGI